MLIRRGVSGTKPTISSNTTVLGKSIPSPLSVTEGALAGVSQPVPLGRRLSKAREAEQLERDRRVLELKARHRDLRKRVHSTFAAGLYQEKAFQTQRELVASGQKAVAITKARVEAGDAMREELARAEMELLRAQVELRRAEAMREHSMVELKAAIGDPGLRVATLAGTLEATFEIPTLEILASNLFAYPEAASAGAEIRVRQARAFGESRAHSRREGRGALSSVGRLKRKRF